MNLPRAHPPARARLSLAALLGLSLLALTTSGPLPVTAGGGSSTVVGGVAADGRYIVTWKPGVAPAGVSAFPGAAAVLQARGQRSILVAEPGRSAELRNRLARDARVASATPDPVVATQAWPDTAPSDPSFAAQWNLRQVGVPELWRSTSGSRDIVVATIDSGLDYLAPDLRHVPIVGPKNLVAGTTGVTDLLGHGTWVTGVVANRTDNGVGLAGIAPRASVMPIRVVDANGVARLSGIMDGIDAAIAGGASVVNISLGGRLALSYGPAYQPVIDRAIAAGVTIVAAAGNNGADGVTDFFPCAYQGVICVGSTDRGRDPSAFSNAGPIVTVAAPGEDILVGSREVQALSGTSLAAPHVTGIVALLRSEHPGATPAQVREALVTSATDLGPAGRDDATGAGLVNGPRALAALGELRRGAGAGDAPSATAPFRAIVLEPAVETARDEVAATRVVWATSTRASVATLTEETAMPEAGVCPTDGWTPVRATEVSAAVLWASGGPNLCHRWRVRATSPAGEVDEATSPAVLYRNEAPEIIARSPAPGAAGVDRDLTLRLRISEDVRCVDGRVVLRDVVTGQAVRAVVDWHGRTDTIALDPVERLAPRTAYRLVVKCGIVDDAGSELPATSWTFRTGSD